MGWHPMMTEHFGSLREKAVSADLERIGECDLMLLLVGWRRGWVPQPDEGGNGTDSITALEFKLARERAIPVLAMMTDEKWPAKLSEEKRDARDWVERFRANLNIPAMFFGYQAPVDDATRGLPAFRATVHRLLASNSERLLEQNPHLRSREERTAVPHTIPRLFLCYRRDDTQDAAGRLHDRLVDAYGEESVFMDIDSVPLGVDFVEFVTEQIASCRAVVVMIGQRWVTIRDKQRRRRLDNPDDLVRAEVAAALKRKIPVIPVLVQNAPMPSADVLPEDLRLLARRNGLELSATRWKGDVQRLLTELDKYLPRRTDA